MRLTENFEFQFFVRNLILETEIAFDRQEFLLKKEIFNIFIFKCDPPTF